VKHSPIFIKVFETTLWLLDHTRKFPKDQRFTMAKRIEDTFLSFYDAILDATDLKGATATPFSRRLNAGKDCPSAT